MFWVAIAAPFGERNFVRKFETRSLPNSLAASPRGFAFYIADPITSIRGFTQIHFSWIPGFLIHSFFALATCQSRPITGKIWP